MDECGGRGGSLRAVGVKIEVSFVRVKLGLTQQAVGLVEWLAIALCQYIV